MKISITRFVIIFLVSAFAFQFISNSVLGSEVRLFPVNGDWFPGMASQVAWKNMVATILYPIKLVLVGPLATIFKFPDPDPAPPVLPTAFALYWTAIALVLYFLFNKIFIRKQK